MLKELIKTNFRKFCSLAGIQIVALSNQQKELLKRNPNLRYRHLVIQDAIVMQRGQITLSEAKFLGKLVANLQSEGPIMEIGTLFGWSTRIICLFMDNDRQLISVDNFSWNPFNLPSDMHFEITNTVLADAISAGHLHLLRMSNLDFYNSYSGPTPAMIFIDADHEYEAVEQDIQGAMKLGAKVICGHDYDEKKCLGVVKAVNEHGGAKKVVGTLWVLG